MFDIALLGSGCFVCYLALCTVVVLRTGDTSGLRDVALAVQCLRRMRQLS
ncbi:MULTISPECIES: hypothetical protein [Nocardia]|jgi:hypothetical protein|nr:MULTISPECIES: hypothetical protein [Nocardia]MBV7707946.1 hypothetical protein [Nocardia nova]